ncbi:hypothetical protein JTZ10_21655 [Gordonia rubripertincta]|uniref:Terminase n=1 Tax=Gordonia rubripertincta TaxID=36822 RepID=A0AAW4GAJ2_GORRU|nr:hypothetical protein [Gordonia rubripertincta]MBM7280354.1 hypothetical protein [Gordonia rubripertincta]
MSTKKPSAPVGLSVAGSAMWTEIVNNWDLRSDELRVLKDACFEADLIDSMQASIGEQMLTEGSQGQKVASPLLSELRMHRSTLSSLLKQLKLPDAADTPEARSTQARSAANARWHKRTG